jgi:hypothetical protein
MDHDRYTADFYNFYRIRIQQDPDLAEEEEDEEEVNAEAGPENAALALPAAYDASASSSSSCTGFVDPSLWEHLPEELTEIVLSFLPIHRFWETVMAIDSHKWTAILSNPDLFSPQTLGHMRHVNSSYGYVLCKFLCARRPAPTAGPVIAGFEHETNSWLTLPSFPQEGPKNSKVHVVSASGGLLCVGTPLEHMDGTMYASYGIWNPLLHSLRWLPASPDPAGLDPRFLTLVTGFVQVHLVVNQLQRSYALIHVHTHPTLLLWWSYAVYKSSTRRWSESRVIRPLRDSDQTILSNLSVSCGDFVCFLGHVRGGSFRFGILVYSTVMDTWRRSTVSENLIAMMLYGQESPRSRRPIVISLHALVVVEGKVYLILSHCIEEFGQAIEFHITSMDPSTPSALVMRHVTVVPASLIDLKARGRYYWYTCLIRGRPFICNIDGQRLLKYDIRANSWSSIAQTWPVDENVLYNYGRFQPFEPSFTPA